jgi:hypothetical protein
MTRHLGHESQDRTKKIEQRELDRQNWTGRIERVEKDRQKRVGRTRLPGQDSRTALPAHDCYSKIKTARGGQKGEDSQNRTGRARQAEQDRKNRTGK